MRHRRRDGQFAGIPVWHPHQLRHTLATEAKRLVGEEAAATLLSVSSEKTAKVYARVTAEAVREIMERLYGSENEDAPGNEPGES